MTNAKPGPQLSSPTWSIPALWQPTNCTAWWQEFPNHECNICMRQISCSSCSHRPRLCLESLKLSRRQSPCCFWERFCSQRTSAISVLDVLRRCALQTYILLTYLLTMWVTHKLDWMNKSQQWVAIYLTHKSFNFYFTIYARTCLQHYWLSIRRYT